MGTDQTRPLDYIQNLENNNDDMTRAAGDGAQNESRVLTQDLLGVTTFW